MGVFSRLADIINSNLSALLDRAEDPAKTIRLMIQEMEETLVETRANAARLIADSKGLKRRRRQLDEAITDWQRKAELALSKGREDLARGALAEKARITEAVQAGDQELTQLDEALARYEEDVARLQAKLDEAKVRQKAILARQETASQRLKVRKSVDDRRIDHAFTRFEHMERRVERLEGEVESFDLGKGQKEQTLADELAQLETSDVVEAELAALKAKMGAGRSESAGNA
jgi:phage shock protein A